MKDAGSGFVKFPERAIIYEIPQIPFHNIQILRAAAEAIRFNCAQIVPVRIKYFQTAPKSCFRSVGKKRPQIARFLAPIRSIQTLSHFVNPKTHRHTNSHITLDIVCQKVVHKMREGPSEPACRIRFQTTSSCCGQKPWW